MPDAFGTGALPVVLPLVASALIALMSLVIAGVVVSRVIRLARGGPDAARLRQQLRMQQQRSARGGTHDALANGGQQALLDLQQQTAIDVSNASIHTGPPS